MLADPPPTLTPGPEPAAPEPPTSRRGRRKERKQLKREAKRRSAYDRALGLGDPAEVSVAPAEVSVEPAEVSVAPVEKLPEEALEEIPEQERLAVRGW